MNYAIRLTFPAVELRHWMSRVSMVSEKCCFYEHSENVARVHIHGIVCGCTVSDQTLKNWVQEALGLTPVGSEWSFKQTYGKGKEKKRVDDGYIAYMSKGKYDPVYCVNYTEQEVAEWKTKGFDKKEIEALSPDEVLYNEFKDFMKSSEHGPQNDVVPKDFAWVKKWARAKCIAKYKVMNMNCCAKIKMLVLTYCWYEGVSIPEKEVKFTI